MYNLIKYIVFSLLLVFIIHKLIKYISNHYYNKTITDFIYLDNNLYTIEKTCLVEKNDNENSSDNNAYQKDNMETDLQNYIKILKRDKNVITDKNEINIEKPVKVNSSYFINNKNINGDEIPDKIQEKQKPKLNPKTQNESQFNVIN